MSLRTILTTIFSISLAGTIISLYFWYFGDPIANMMSGDLFNSANALIPCSLCRYARIALYPMVIISLLWLQYHDKHSIIYITPLSCIGILITGYQILLQAWVFQESGVCLAWSKSCAFIDWQYFWITIPMLACVAFVLILGLCITQYIKHKKH